METSQFMKAMRELDESFRPYIHQTCMVCSKPCVQKLRKCAGCRVAYYCGKDHQKKHWSVHKKHCEQLCALKTQASSQETFWRKLPDCHQILPLSLSPEAAAAVLARRESACADVSEKFNWAKYPDGCAWRGPCKACLATDRSMKDWCEDDVARSRTESWTS